MLSKRFLAILMLIFLVVILPVGCSKEASNDDTGLPANSDYVSDNEDGPPPSNDHEDEDDPLVVESTSPTLSPSLPTTTTPLTMLSIAEGEIFIMKAGTDEWVLAQVGTTLEPSDIIKAGDNSHAEIIFFKGSTIELQAGSQIEVVELDFAIDSGSTIIKLKQEIGKTISRVTKLTDPASLYEVETPAGIAAIRGSIMLLDVTSSGTTTVTNQQGNIWASAQGTEVRVPIGMWCIIVPGQSPQLHTQVDSGSTPK